MALKQKLRSEIDKNYQWDLSLIYKTLEEWNKDYKEVLEEMKEISKYEKTVLDNANNLYNYL